MAQEYESVDLVGDDTVRNLAGAAVLAALTAALAQLSIPIPSVGVPFSLQPFGPFLAGLVLGPLWGGFAMALYLAAGTAGAPVFSNGAAGIGHFGGRTGGFLVGFALSAVVVGAVAHRGIEVRPVSELSVPVELVAVAAGLVVVYAVGLPWMAEVLGVSVGRAAGLMAPYAVPDVVKVFVTVAVVEGGAVAVRE
ncbi:BioY protein [Halosimplex carlsbadense 2-9-1]|uniref:BioY protein n=1 Tax=Halosimplex carlsbadense 2-9-1 TaxID=797114 RepID=M0CGL2_9EURY|nr:biotin transporter BioY [Halosimplex carlsbadense]ELZ22425.1 BioY protein [Halosimplex carlsbadense 2-9-1]